jgi:nucleotide-binding universal stress UspA family protein
MVEIAPRHRLVVGVDGTANSVSALRWAAEQALRFRNAEIWAVHTWYRWSTGMASAPDAVTDVWSHENARWWEEGTTLHTTVSAAFGDNVGCPVRKILDFGAPAGILLRYAAHADLLVLGSRTRHDLGIHATAVAGPTARACRQHATCPVVVVASAARTTALLHVKHVATSSQHVIV